MFLQTKNVLLIDFMNIFIRNYCGSPFMDLTGNPCGGIIGTITSIASLVEQFKPSKVILCYDGKKGRERRKKVNEHYKSTRKTAKLNRQYDGMMTPDEEKENKYQQIEELNAVLDHLPFVKVEVDTCEADDIIAYIAENLYNDYNKIIVSTDKDFLQLVGGNIYVYSPIKKIFYDRDKIREEFNVHNKDNFIILKSFLGDKSDNLNNIKGIGDKTIQKLFPVLFERDGILLEDIFEYAQDKIREGSEHSEKYRKILEHKEMVFSNYRISQLQSSVLNSIEVESIKNQLTKSIIYNVILFRAFLDSKGVTVSIDFDGFSKNMSFLRYHE